ncbi:MAG: PVC-type heme-binding CxxCH protein [Pirellulales bacterium]
MKTHLQLLADLLLGVSIAMLGSSAAAQQSPAEELSRLQPAAESRVSLFAAEPLITNPAAIDVDSHGRVWVAEIQWYRSQAKRPPADKIKVLEDTDADGKADKVTTFAEGLFCPMSICVAGDKVYVATSPDLWEYEDQDGDLKADGPPRKLLSGFGGFNSDHGAHSLVLGPDHKWWMSIGDAGFKLTGTDGSRIAYEWGAMLRGELDGSQLEIVASNFRNPYELCVNSFGEAFVSDNDNDGNESTRFCWILEGGNYGWYGHPPERALPGTPWGEHWHFRGHIPGHVPALLVTGFGAPSGMCFYEGDAWGPKFKNVALLAESGRREICLFRPHKREAGMEATSEVVFTSTDSYFRPDDVCAGPDGSLYVADWYDGGVGGHAYNNPKQGRIFLLRPQQHEVQRRLPPGPYDNIAEALEALKSANLATQYLARERLLAEGQSSVPGLAQLLTNADPNIRARALWVLDRIGGGGRDLVVQQLANQDPAFRALAVRILRRHGDAYLAAILPLADDSSGEVVREVLLSIRATKGAEASGVLFKLARRYDGSDRYLLEAIHIAAAGRQQELYERLAAEGGFTPAQFNLLQLLSPAAARDRLREQLLAANLDDETFSQLLASASAMRDPQVGKLLLTFVGTSSVAPDLRRCAMETIAARLAGQWSALRKDPQLVSTFQAALADTGLQESALQVVQSYRLQWVDEDVLRLATDTRVRDAVRCAALQTTVQLAKSDTKLEQLQKLLQDPRPTVREAALRALVIDLQDLATARDGLCGQDDAFTPVVRGAVAAQALDTPGGARMMFQLVEEDKLAAELKQHLIAQAAQHPDANVRLLFEQFVPLAKRQQRLGETISAVEILKLQGDSQRGAAIFHQNSAAQCLSCHQVHGKGGTVGPELSSIGRKFDPPQLLETILKPSQAMAPEYVPYVVETRDGRVLGGLLVEKAKDVIVLKDAQGRIIRLAADNVESMVAQRISMMPELVLQNVSAQDAADLLAYLGSLR